MSFFYIQNLHNYYYTKRWVENGQKYNNEVEGISFLAEVDYELDI